MTSFKFLFDLIINRILLMSLSESSFFWEYTEDSLGETSLQLGGILSVKHIIHHTDTAVLLLNQGVFCSHCVKQWFLD